MNSTMESEIDWNLTPKQAIALQNELRNRVCCVDAIGPVQLVAGVDVGFEQNSTVTRAAIAVLSFPQLELVEYAISRAPTRFPYVPGLLSFRELPAVLEAITQLKATPDLCLVDGQGYAHPRRFGIACHLGVLTNIPSIGVAKTRLIGTHEDVATTRGAWQPLVHRDEIIGAALRTKSNTKPLFVSVGHRVSLKTAIELTLACTTKFRLPETTRHAHRLASGPNAHT
jgi:deoxyribonuclease V